MDEYYVYVDEHDGEGWFRPLGDIAMTKDEARDFIMKQHYACLRDEEELGIPYPNYDYQIRRKNNEVNSNYVRW